jgi:hypothetical protein
MLLKELKNLYVSTNQELAKTKNPSSFLVKKNRVLKLSVNYILKGDFLTQKRLVDLVKTFWNSNLNAKMTAEIMGRSEESVRVSISRVNKKASEKITPILTLLSLAENEENDSSLLNINKAEKLAFLLEGKTSSLLLPNIESEISDYFSNVPLVATLNISKKELQLLHMFSKTTFSSLMEKVNLSVLRLVFYILNSNDPRYENEKFILGQLLSGVISVENALELLGEGLEEITTNV